MSTLLVGASSPLGRAVAEELGAAGVRVTSASRRGPLRLDVTDPASVDGVFATAFDTVVYLATPSPDDPDGAARHLAGLDHVLDRSRASGVRRLVYASSAAVYGTRSSGRVRETDALRGGSGYARLKIDSELLLAEATRGGLSAVALRIFNVYGPGFSSSLVNRLLDRDEIPGLQVSDRFVRDYVHATDVARAVRLATRADVDGFAAVNVGTGAGVSTADLARWAPPGSFAEVPAGDGGVSVADPTLAEETLGFRAERRLEDAFHAAGR